MPFFFLDAGSVFCSCKQLLLLQEASVVITSFTGKYQLNSSISEWHPAEIFIFPQQDLFGCHPGLSLFPVLLEFSWSCPLLLTACIHSSGLSSQVHLCHSVQIVLCKEPGFVSFHTLTVQHTLTRWGFFLDKKPLIQCHPGHSCYNL